MSKYIIAALLILILAAGGVAYYEFLENGKLESANGDLQSALDTAVQTNKDNEAAIKTLQADHEYQSKIVAAVDAEQLSMQNTKQNAITKVNNAKSSKCPMPLPITAAVGGMYDLRSTHAHKD